MDTNSPDYDRQEHINYIVKKVMSGDCVMYRTTPSFSDDRGVRAIMDTSSLRTLLSEGFDNELPANNGKHEDLAVLLVKIAFTLRGIETDLAEIIADQVAKEVDANLDGIIEYQQECAQ